MWDEDPSKERRHQTSSPGIRLTRSATPRSDRAARLPRRVVAEDEADRGRPVAVAEGLTPSCLMSRPRTAKRARHARGSRAVDHRGQILVREARLLRDAGRRRRAHDDAAPSLRMAARSMFPTTGIQGQRLWQGREAPLPRGGASSFRISTSPWRSLCSRSGTVDAGARAEPARGRERSGRCRFSRS